MEQMGARRVGVALQISCNDCIDVTLIRSEVQNQILSFPFFEHILGTNFVSLINYLINQTVYCTTVPSNNCMLYKRTNFQEREHSWAAKDSDRWESSRILDTLMTIQGSPKAAVKHSFIHSFILLAGAELDAESGEPAFFSLARGAAF